MSSDRIVIHVKISFSATTIVASGMKTNEKRRDEGVDATLSLFLSSSRLFEGRFFILATGGGFNDTNIIAFSERRFSPYAGHRFIVFLPPVFKKLSFFSILIEVSLCELDVSKINTVISNS